LTFQTELSRERRVQIAKVLVKCGADWEFNEKGKKIASFVEQEQSSFIRDMLNSPEYQGKNRLLIDCNNLIHILRLYFN
jgi:hypothetical protein